MEPMGRQETHQRSDDNAKRRRMRVSITHIVPPESEITSMPQKPPSGCRALRLLRHIKLLIIEHFIETELCQRKCPVLQQRSSLIAYAQLDLIGVRQKQPALLFEVREFLGHLVARLLLARCNFVLCHHARIDDLLILRPHMLKRLGVEEKSDSQKRAVAWIIVKYVHLLIVDFLDAKVLQLGICRSQIQKRPGR